MRAAVWKVGGSLFDLPDLAARLSSLLATADHRVLLLPGGGASADLVRDWQRRTAIDDEAAHWLAIGALDFNAQLLASILPTGRVVTTPAEAEFAWEHREQPILAPTPVVRDVERRLPLSALPHDWTVTSDSLAAWLAAAWPMDRLVLLKSCALPAGMNPRAASDAGLVDPYFWRVAPTVPRIAWCDVRAATPVIQEWPSA